jgi:preprotein translocase subunit SecE
MSSVVNQITEYLKGAQEELRKVVWPSRQETIRSTIAVIAISVAMGAFFWVLDLIFSKVLSLVLTK